MTIEVPPDNRPSRFSRFDNTPARVEADPYPTVDQRVHAFLDEHPLGTIRTTIVETVIGVLGDQRYVVRAEVWRDTATNYPPAASAHSTRSTRDRNEVSAEFPLETAETIAVGRALRWLGFGKGPSADELAAVAEPTEV